MQRIQLKDAVHGIIVPLVTPLESQDRLDLVGLERLIEHVIDGGVSGIFILGTTGEGPSLSYPVRSEMIQAVCRQVADRVPVLVGVTDTAYERTMAMAQVAEAAGASAIVVAPPCYFRISQSDLLRYLERCAADSALPLFLYNMPSLTKTAYEPDTVQRGSGIPGIIGLKDSSGDLEYVQSVVGSVGTKFPVMMGPEEYLVDAMRVGATGGVCGGANLNPRLFVDLYRLTAAGDFEKAAKLQARVREISDALYTVGHPCTSYLRGLKSALAAKGLCASTCALPFAPFTADEQRMLESRLEALGCME
jgi:4-hydroxy-tetrahydrodipicolinate synthase